MRIRNRSEECTSDTNQIFGYTDAQGNKQYEDVFHPVTKEGRELLVKNVLDAYKQALEQAQTNSQTQSQTSGSQTMQQM